MVRASVGRRDFLTALGGMAIFPVAATAAPGNNPTKIGILWHAANEQEEAPFPKVLRERLQELGYIDGRNIVLLNTFADENYDRFKENAERLVSTNVDIILAINLRAAQAAQQATSRIPIIFLFVGDPVATKLVASFAHPGGNITGLSQIAEDLAAKRLNILKNMTDTSRAALLVNSANPVFAKKSIEESQSASRSLGIVIEPIEVSRTDELEPAFATMASNGLNSVIVASDSMFWRERRRIADLALRFHIASVFAIRDHADVGGLVSYGPSLPAIVRRAAEYIDKVIKGEHVGDIPVERPTRIELVINSVTAKQLGIQIPAELLATADEVIGQ
jgi:putative tryptophan/tyrosine transport system substrate-binding protein